MRSSLVRDGVAPRIHDDLGADREAQELTGHAAKPVRRYPNPAYPTKRECLQHPDLLLAHLPASWLSCSDVAGAVAVLLSANATGCSLQPDASASEGNARAAHVAPIAGSIVPQIARRDRGMSACVAVAPPTYLSEEEALQIIVEEMAQVGVDAWETNVEFKSVGITGLTFEHVYDWINEHATSGVKEVVKPLELDLFDAKHKVGIEYVGRNETLHLGGGRSSGAGTPKAVARHVSKEVQKQGEEIYFGAFYYPGEDLDFTLKYSRGKKAVTAKTECKKLLRQQVNGFVEWLKGQGIM